MPSGASEYTIRVHDSLRDIEAPEWNRMAMVRRGDGSREDNPFLSHEFLSALEESGSAVAETGWLGQHLVLQDAGGKPVAALPCYLKNHSQGEYVFDHGWADAFHRAGGAYYPKLQCSVPFTPATGPRFLTGDSARPEPVRAALLAGLEQLAGRLGASSVHITFMREDEQADAEAAGWLPRLDRQFHWFNRGYRDFGEFLDALSSRKRKNIRKEREQALGANGLTVQLLTGAELTEAVWDRFFEFYMDTGSRKWGRPYLTRKFFSLAGERMAERILLVMAERAGRYVAGAINFIGDDCLYGRHWGCTEHHSGLHFEICYYQAIEYAIAHGLKRVEAGAQGEHKLARGYEPVVTRSAHYVVHPGLRAAVADYLEQERHYVSREARLLQAHAPFRQVD